MTVGRNILKHSAVYSVGSLLEQSIGLILLPVYTRVLTAGDMGVVAVARSIGEVVTLVLALGLHGGASRLYFDYRDDPRALREFWGTIFTFLMLFATVVGLAIAFLGKPLFVHFSEGVAYQPFIVLALITAALNPPIATYLRTLQTRQKSLKYVVMNSGRFLFTVLLIVFLVVGLGMGAKGPLLGYTIIAGAYWFIVFIMLAREVTFCLKWKYLRHALGFSLPIVPTTISGKVGSTADRIIINEYVGTDAAGVYHIGYSLANVLSIIVTAVNTAFSPIFRDAMKTRNEGKLRELRNFSLFIIYGYCVLGALLSVFAGELVTLITGPEFHAAHVIVSLVAFVGVMRGVYSIFSSVMQYFRITLWQAFFISVFATSLNLALNFWWIPVMGIIGAGWAALASQTLTTILSGLAGYRYARVQWPYARYAGLVLSAMAMSFAVGAIDWPSIWVAIPAKLVACGVMSLVLSFVAWGKPLYVFRIARTELQRIVAPFRKQPSDGGE